MPFGEEAMADGVPHVSIDKSWRSAYFWNRTLFFTIPRVVVIQIWQLGLLYYILCAGVVGYVVYEVQASHTWALQEVPDNRINAWVEGEAAANVWEATPASMDATFPYCGNSSAYSYTYSADFDYSDPQCEFVHSYEVATKLPSALVVATVYLDVIEEGWACSAANSASRQAVRLGLDCHILPCHVVE